MKQIIGLISASMIFLFLLVPFVYPITAYIRPGKIILNVELNPFGNTDVGGFIELKNLDSTTTHVSLKPTGLIASKMELSENEFNLEAGESKIIYFYISLTSLGTYKGGISATYSLIGQITLSTSIEVDITINALSYSTGTTTTVPFLPTTTTIPWVCREYEETCSSDSDCCLGACQEKTVCSRISMHGICLAYRTDNVCVGEETPTTTTAPTTTTTTPTTTTPSSTTTTIPTGCLTSGEECSSNPDCCSDNCQEEKVCHRKTIHGVCSRYGISRVCVQGSKTTTTTTSTTTTTLPTVTTTIIPTCLTSGQTCSLNEECCSGNCKYSKVCFQYDLHGVCQRYSYKYTCA